MKNVCNPPLLESSGLRKARVLASEDDVARIRKDISWNGREFRVNSEELGLMPKILALTAMILV